MVTLHKKNKTKLFFISFFIICSLYKFQNTIADSPIVDMVADGGYDWLKLGKKKRIYKITRPDSVPKESNYWSIFASDSGPKRINEWLGKADESFVFDSKIAGYKDDCAFLKNKYVNFKFKKYRFTVTVLLPYPHLAVEITDVKLIPQLAMLEPPGLDVKTLEKINVQGFEASLFFQKNNHCAVHIPLPKTSLLFAEVDNCEISSELVRLLESLDIKRVAQKIMS